MWSSDKLLLKNITKSFYFRCFISVFQGYTFLISSDYEREEWREIIREQQKKCKHCCSSQKPSKKITAGLCKLLFSFSLLLVKCRYWWLHWVRLSWFLYVLLSQVSRVFLWLPWSCRCSPTPVWSYKQFTMFLWQSIKKVSAFFVLFY